MAEKIVKTIATRVLQKTDTKANWDKATNFVPKKGELIVYSDLRRIKVGDGTTKVGDLQFLADSDTNTHQSIKTLKTDNTTAQSPSSGEAIAGSGTISLHKVSKTGSYNDLLNKPTIPTIPTNYVTTNTAQTITGIKTFNAPTNTSGEQATATFKTANGGQIIFGKEGANSGSMIALDQVAGTRRLNFRASATPGAIVWSQPESGSALFYDVDNVYFRQPDYISFNSATKIILGKIKNAAALGTDENGKIVAKTLIKGDKGDKGDPGTPVKVSSIQYQESSSNTTAPGSWSNTVVSAPAGHYLWTKITFSDGKIAYSVARQGNNGNDGKPGAAATITVGTVSKGDTASVTNVGTSSAAKFNFVLPKGDKGNDGASAGFGTPTATVDANVGTPSVTVTASGANTSKVFNFAFKNLKGATGGQGPTGPQGPQGDPGCTMTYDPQTNTLTIAMK